MTKLFAFMLAVLMMLSAMFVTAGEEAGSNPLSTVIDPFADDMKGTALADGIAALISNPDEIQSFSFAAERRGSVTRSKADAPYDSSYMTSDPAYINEAVKLIAGCEFSKKPKTYEEVGALISGKQAGSILWCARMIDWKHPEVPILIAERLKNSGFSFRLNMIGCGPMQQQLEEMIKCKGLESHVFLLGSMSPQHVRSEMEKSEVFLFTSDRNEGWGAVLNEAMNSACAVVASHAIGSVPFLINDKENGLIYKDGSIDEIYRHVVCLLTAPALRRSISEKAYFTIVNEWNAKNAAHRFLRLAEEIISGKTPQPFEKGLCSCAEVLKDDWYR